MKKFIDIFDVFLLLFISISILFATTKNNTNAIFGYFTALILLTRIKLMKEHLTKINK
jgi:hypothetical protein